MERAIRHMHPLVVVEDPLVMVIQVELELVDTAEAVVEAAVGERVMTAVMVE